MPTLNVLGSILVNLDISVGPDSKLAVQIYTLKGILEKLIRYLIASNRLILKEFYINSKANWRTSPRNPYLYKESTILRKVFF